MYILESLDMTDFSEQGFPAFFSKSNQIVGATALPWPSFLYKIPTLALGVRRSETASQFKPLLHQSPFQFGI